MPTGYTSKIKDGITFNKFIWQCARAFGALVEMRDDPFDAEIPEKLKLSSYHQNALNKAIKERDKYFKMTVTEAAIEVDNYITEETANYYKRVADNKDLIVKYNTMLEQAKQWQAPSEDHIELKKFMIQQINESIKYDCNDDYYKLPEAITAEKWIDNRYEEALKDITYHSKGLQEDIERTNGRNLWLQQLRESLQEN